MNGSFVLLVALTVAVAGMTIIPCLVDVSGLTSLDPMQFFPTYFYGFSRLFLILLVSLGWFSEPALHVFLERWNPEWIKGFVYGAYAVLAYFLVTNINSPFTLFGLNFMPQSLAFLYYITAVLILFEFLCRRFTPSRAFLASFFTVFLSGVIWEMPILFCWTTWKPVDFPILASQLVIFALTIPACKLFQAQVRNVLWFIPLSAFLVAVGYLNGKPPLTELTNFLGRIPTLLLLSYILWRKRDGLD